MKDNQALYTKEPDGTIQTWYVWGWVGNRFAVAPRKNAKLRDYKRYYTADQLGKDIFLTRKDL